MSNRGLLVNFATIQLILVKLSRRDTFAVCKKCGVDNRLSYLGRILECHEKRID